jgi:hypothetical protein
VTLVLLLLLAGCASPGAEKRPEPTASNAAVAPTPTFADVTRGDTASVVRLWAYDRTARSVVVEPVVFMQGPDFCAEFAVPDTDPRCEQDWTTEDSRLKVTLPVRPDATFAAVNGDPQACMSDKTGAGTCPVSARRFATWLKEGPEALVRLTTVDGAVTAMAEVYVP